MSDRRPPKKKPGEIRRDPLKEIEMTSEDWAAFEHGVKLFNSGKFWNSHEAWEQIWLRHNEDERLFFQGLIQLAAAYHQLLIKGSQKGLLNNFEKAYEKLEVFQPEYLGVLVQPLLKFIDEGRKEANRLGSPKIAEFNHNLVPKLQFHKPANPDLMVEIRGFINSEKFHEGAKLFNTGYYWEAHESWEDVWRDQEGDAKTFSQAFVQMAAAYSFLKLSKAGSARYLFEKSIAKFLEFENLECGMQVKPLIESMQLSLRETGAAGENGHSVPRFKKPAPVPIPTEA